MSPRLSVSRAVPASLESILLIRLDEMGDFVLFTSILRPLRKAHPRAWITLVVCDWVRPLAVLCPYVDEVIAFPTSGPKWWQYIAGPWRAWKVASRLSHSYDIAINPRFDRDIRGAAFLARFSGAPCVAGYASSTDPFKTVINDGYDRVYTHLLPVGPAARHEVERSAAVLDFLNVGYSKLEPEIWMATPDHHAARRMLRHQGWRPDDVLICLGINAGYARKRWPLESFVDLARRLVTLPDVKILLVGGPHDKPGADRLRRALGNRLIDLTGLASLRVSAAAIEQCRLYVGNDSGPKHVAAALGKPVVEINCHPQSGDPEHFQAPARFSAVANSAITLAPEHPLAPCNASCLAAEPHCITQVSVDHVFEAVSETAILTWTACP